MSTVTTADVLAYLRNGELLMTAYLLREMSTDNPAGAQLIREAIAEVEAERRRRRGADPLWAEHVAEEWTT